MNITEKRNIPFSPLDVTENEIDKVVSTLKSGWITKGPRIKELEKEVAKRCGIKKLFV